MGVLGPLTFQDVMMVIVVAAAVATYQFFRGRKLNVMLMYHTMKVVEEVLNPQDKNYTLLGTYVGYTAIYDLEGPIRKAEVTVTLLPRQSFFYFPVSLLTSRYDKAYVRFILSDKVVREAHVVAKRYYRLGVSRTIEGFSNMRREDVVIGGKKYFLIYTSRGAVRKLVSFLKSLSNPSVVKHVALVPANRSIYLAVKLEPENLKEVIQKGYALAKSLASER